MDEAPAAGLTVMRAWAASVDGTYALQTQPGAYNEAVFRGLDYALDEARKRNLKVLQPGCLFCLRARRLLAGFVDPSFHRRH